MKYIFIPTSGHSEHGPHLFKLAKDVTTHLLERDHLTAAHAEQILLAIIKMNPGDSLKLPTGAIIVLSRNTY